VYSIAKILFSELLHSKQLSWCWWSF